MAKLRIRVTCRETGLPIPGAGVQVRLPEPETPPRPHEGQVAVQDEFTGQLLTDDRGKVELEIPAGLPYRLAVSAPGFSRSATGLDTLEPSDIPHDEPSKATGREGTEKPLRPPLCDLRFQGLKRRYTFCAADPESREQYLTAWPCLSVRKDGSIEFWGLDPQAFPVHEARLTVEVPGFALAEAPPLHTLPFLDGRISLSLRLDAGRVLRGRVLLPGGSRRPGPAWRRPWTWPERRGRKRN